MGEDQSSTLIYALIALATVIYFARLLKPGQSSVRSSPNFHSRLLRLCAQLRGIPAIGPTAPILSYYGAIQYLSRGREMVQEGYDKVNC